MRETDENPHASREVPAAVRLLVFLGALALVFTATTMTGSRFGSAPSPATAQSHSAPGGAEHAAVPSAPGGLQVSQQGYTFALDRAVRPAGTQEIAFEITGPDQQPLTSYQVEHEKELHLIAVRRDLTGFQHVHPARDAAGVWRTQLDLTPGAWRLFADFSVAADATPDARAMPLTLGTDLLVPGEAGVEESTGAVGEVRRDEVDDLRVEVSGDLTAGTTSELRFSVSQDGRPAQLEPYLGARGHLVALRRGDLAYLHVHPVHAGSTPGEVVFAAEVPSEGVYRLFVDFRVAGTVRSAKLTLDAAPSGADDASGSNDHAEDDTTH